jgi:hypothetical protein
MCDCRSESEIQMRSLLRDQTVSKREVSLIDNKWIWDNLGRKLLVQGPIHDIYGDIIGYITKNEDGNIIRIFKKNIKQILD